MEEMINNVNIIDTEEKSLEQQIVIEVVKKIKEPFKMLSVEYVMKDLELSYVTTYEIFKKKDFPAIQIGKKKMVPMLGYVVWKLKNVERVVRK